ncbi:hypothetical protein Tco_1190196 [Tanacetum coccineum]
MVGSNRNDKLIKEESVPKGINNASLKDIPLIVLSDDDSDVPVTQKRRKLTKNGKFVNDNDINLISFDDENILPKYDINTLDHGSLKDQMEVSPLFHGQLYVAV